MDIGEFSKKTGLTIDTLRYYNKLNLLVPSRNKNRRFYTEDDFEKAIAIVKLKKLNFTLDEIKSLFDLEESIESLNSLSPYSLDEISLCLDIIKNKFDDILKQEQDLILIKSCLEKMITKTNLLLKNKNLPIYSVK